MDGGTFSSLPTSSSFLLVPKLHLGTQLSAKLSFALARHLNLSCAPKTRDRREA